MPIFKRREVPDQLLDDTYVVFAFDKQALVALFHLTHLKQNAPYRVILLIPPILPKFFKRKRMVARMEKAHAKRDAATYHEINMAFHERMVELVGNRKLLQRETDKI